MGGGGGGGERRRRLGEAEAALAASVTLEQDYLSAVEVAT